MFGADLEGILYDPPKTDRERPVNRARNMAARKQLWHPDAIREKMRVAQLVKRLEDHAFGEVEMTTTQISAAKIIVERCIPALQAVTLGGTGEDGSISIRWLPPT